MIAIVKSFNQGATMDQLKVFFQYLYTNKIDLTSLFTQNNGVWTLKQDFLGMTSGTAFNSIDDLLTRVYSAIQGQHGSHLKQAV
jgi:hypothetical protein